MIPLEYQNMQTWIRLNNRILAEEDKKEPGGMVSHKSYINGARFVMKLLARQWAFDVKARRKLDETISRGR